MLITLNNRIKVRRAELSITQDELAHQVEVTRQTIIAIEKGDYNPSTKLALQIAQALQCDINNIFYLSTNAKNNP